MSETLTPAPSASRSAAGKLAVIRLNLSEFRCYGALRLEPEPSSVVLTGPNGAGKTNLLEAVSLLVPGRGLRRARLSEIGRRDVGAAPDADRDQGHESRPWAVAASLETPAGRVDIGTGLEAGTGKDKRVVRIDGAPARGQAALAAVASAIWLTPQMDRLFLEAASGRRRFLDRLVYGLEPGHAAALAGYEHALRERARLLRDGKGDPAWLAALEETMAAKGVVVAQARNDLAARLTEACAAGIGPFPAALVSIAGGVERSLSETDAGTVEARLKERLRVSRRIDAQTGGAIEGPHRSDVRVVHLGKNVAADQCSTGEQKALLIAILLANARLQTAVTGVAPLVLLDEVAAHLDEQRRNALFDEINALGTQAWLSGTDAMLFEGLRGRAQFYRVEDAKVSRQ